MKRTALYILAVSTLVAIGVGVGFWWAAQTPRSSVVDAGDEIRIGLRSTSLCPRFVHIERDLGQMDGVASTTVRDPHPRKTIVLQIQLDDLAYQDLDAEQVQVAVEKILSGTGSVVAREPYALRIVLPRCNDGADLVRRLRETVLDTEDGGLPLMAVGRLTESPAPTARAANGEVRIRIALREPQSYPGVLAQVRRYFEERLGAGETYEVLAPE